MDIGTLAHFIAGTAYRSLSAGEPAIAERLGDRSHEHMLEHP
jgi:hypothetical protein